MEKERRGAGAKKEGSTGLYAADERGGKLTHSAGVHRKEGRGKMPTRRERVLCVCVRRRSVINISPSRLISLPDVCT